MFEYNQSEKKVEYLELIYDLIFVYLIGRNSSLIHHIENGFVSPDLFFTYIICTLIIIQIWNYSTFYINRYGSNGIIEHIGLFVNMYLLYYMADGTTIRWQEHYYRYNIAWVLILLNIALMYKLKMNERLKETPWDLAQMSFTIILLLVQAGIILISLPVYALTGIPLAPLGVVFGIAATLRSYRVNLLTPVDFPHLAERAMLYVVFTFGEMIIAIAGYFEGGFSLNTIYFSVMAFLIVVGLFLSYGLHYDRLLDKEIRTNGTIYMMIHVLLIFALSNITVSLEFMREPEVSLIPKTVFLTVSFLLYYLALFLMQGFGKERLRLTGKCVLQLVVITVGFVTCMAVFIRQMYVNIAASVLFVFAVFGYLFRYWKYMVKE